MPRRHPGLGDHRRRGFGAAKGPKEVDVSGGGTLQLETFQGVFGAVAEGPDGTSEPSSAHFHGSSGGAISKHHHQQNGHDKGTRRRAGVCSAPARVNP